MRVARCSAVALAALASVASVRAGEQVGDHRAAHLTERRAAGVARLPERDALLNIAEQALARGATDAAVHAFEQAAGMLHAADTEMGLVRASMQAGNYRHALAFCAHTAVAHLDSAAAGGLYAWLLRAGGQGAAARRVLDAAGAHAAQDPVVMATRQAFEAASFQTSAVLLELPHRMAPHALMQGAQAAPPTGARMVGGGALIDGGRRALVPSAAIEGAGRLWVRNGLGQTTQATRDAAPDHLQAQGLALLLLAEPLAAEGITFAPRDAFAGSPGVVVGYELAANATPAWPALHQGFLGAFDGHAGLRQLGIDLPAKSSGGAVVFDAAGRLAGITLPGSAGATAMLPVSMFCDLGRAPCGPAGPAQPPASAARMPVDETYERGLKAALQVLGLP